MRDVGELAFGGGEVSPYHLLSWKPFQSSESDRECAMFPRSPREFTQSPGRCKWSRNVRYRKNAKGKWIKGSVKECEPLRSRRRRASMACWTLALWIKVARTFFFFPPQMSGKREECIHHTTCSSVGGRCDGQVRVKQHVGRLND